MRILLLSLFLAGCSTVVPVTQKFPEAPDNLSKCQPLTKLSEEADFSDIAKSISNNYSEYWVCASKVDSWIEWYNKQKTIFEGVK